MNVTSAAKLGTIVFNHPPMIKMMKIQALTMKIRIATGFKVSRSNDDRMVVLGILSGAREAHYALPKSQISVLIERLSLVSGERQDEPTRTLGPVRISAEIEANPQVGALTLSVADERGAREPITLSIERGERLAWDLAQALALLR
jgi:hypothetical protein